MLGMHAQRVYTPHGATETAAFVTYLLKPMVWINPQPIEDRWNMLRDTAPFVFPDSPPRPVHQGEVIRQIEGERLGIGLWWRTKLQQRRSVL